jgi:hypothetical protein
MKGFNMIKFLVLVAVLVSAVFATEDVASNTVRSEIVQAYEVEPLVHASLCCDDIYVDTIRPEVLSMHSVVMLTQYRVLRDSNNFEMPNILQYDPAVWLEKSIIKDHAYAENEPAVNKFFVNEWLLSVARSNAKENGSLDLVKIVLNRGDFDFNSVLKTLHTISQNPYNKDAKKISQCIYKNTETGEINCNSPIIITRNGWCIEKL